MSHSDLFCLLLIDYVFVKSVKECQSTQPGKEKLRQLLYDLCNHVINGQLKPESAASALAEVIVIMMKIQFQLFESYILFQLFNDEIVNVLSDVLLLCGKL